MNGRRSKCLHIHAVCETNTQCVSTYISSFYTFMTGGLFHMSQCICLKVSWAFLLMRTTTYRSIQYLEFSFFVSILFTLIVPFQKIDWLSRILFCCSFILLIFSFFFNVISHHTRVTLYISRTIDFLKEQEELLVHPGEWRVKDEYK